MNSPRRQKFRNLHATCQSEFPCLPRGSVAPVPHFGHVGVVCGGYRELLAVSSPGYNYRYSYILSIGNLIQIMEFKTTAIHAGHDPQEHLGAVMPPIYQTSTFAFRGVNEPGPFDYSRSGNPTRKASLVILLGHAAHHDAARHHPAL